jgi:pimeloyl-ACP methyl ester carboxylesterase
MTADQQVPAWFTDALAQRPGTGRVTVAGAEVSYRTWGPAGAPVTVLVHGGAAHAGWWDHVAPFLADDRRVVALDLSGHGDSDWREAYDLGTWASEVEAVAAAEGDAEPVVLGHSMGGFVALTAATRPGCRLRAAAAVDSPVRVLPADVRERAREVAAAPRTRRYPDRETIVGRFRTLPDDRSDLPYVTRHVAEESVRRVDDGWTWKFDQRIFASSAMSPDMLAKAECPVALVRAERGMATPAIVADVAERLGSRVPVTTVLDSGHHVMLDQPLALVAVLQTLTQMWSTHG